MRLSINELSSNMVVHCFFCARNDEKLFNELHWTVCDIFVRVEFCEILNVYPSYRFTHFTLQQLEEQFKFYFKPP